MATCYSVLSCGVTYAFSGCGLQDVSSKASKLVEEMGGIEVVAKDPKKMEDIVQKLGVKHQLTHIAVRQSDTFAGLTKPLQDVECLRPRRSWPFPECDEHL